MEQNKSDYTVSFYDRDESPEDSEKKLKDYVSQRLRQIREKSKTIDGKKVTTLMITDNTSLSRGTYSGYENGHALPSLKTLNQLAWLYGCDVQHLLGAPYKTRDNEFICNELGISETAVETIKKVRIFNNPDYISWFINNGLFSILYNLCYGVWADSKVVSLYDKLPKEVQQHCNTIFSFYTSEKFFDQALIHAILDAYIDIDSEETTTSLKKKTSLIYRTTKLISTNKSYMDDLCKKQKLSMFLNYKEVKDIAEEWIKKFVPEEQRRIYNPLFEACYYLYAISYTKIKYEREKNITLYKVSTELHFAPLSGHRCVTRRPLCV